MSRIAALGQRCDGSAAALPLLAPGAAMRWNRGVRTAAGAGGAAIWPVSSVLASVLQTASSEFSARANVRDSQLGSLAQ